ncbi:hypothetical protein [Pseudoalteromonas sp. BSi20495]|uniref:hypothetical protein n=1 Tax=Pseudoalteromonas sp. BSi20495 TaxID=386429 RepID=UPI00023159A1|nr:hypothetical protein [Pseudoalteromonas sp. BSi20495]GAA77621.1 hypothetical protein P20495_0101 [Pseudoalteromonas sp. BSi20495]
MKRSSDEEKRQLEHDAAKLFLRCYEQQQGIHMRNIWHNEPNKPDVSCYQENEQLDIEIAHLYASETEAMAVLGRPLSMQMQRDLADMAQKPSEHRLRAALERLLKQKAKKRYYSERTWLVIRNGSTIWRKADFEAVINDLNFPRTYQFEQIWLVCDFYRGELLRVDEKRPI